MFISNQNNYGFDKFQQEIINNLIDNYDKNLLQIIADLYKSMNGEDIDMDGMMNAVDALMKFNKKSKYNYLNDLLYPEIYKNVKIPSPIPVPSCSFQLHNSVTLSTNSLGNLGIIFNPFFLATNDVANDPLVFKLREKDGLLYRTDVLSSFFVNNHDTLTGYESNDNWIPVNIGQMIPPVYNQYRLVSASIVVKYIGRLDVTSGVIGGAIIFDETQEIGAFGKYGSLEGEFAGDYISATNTLTKYGNFDLAIDSHYHQQNYLLDGIRLLYFPIDNYYEEYTKLFGPKLINLKLVTDWNEGLINDRPVMTTSTDYLKNGFKFMIYTLGAPPSSSCFKVDIYCNFECLPDSEFLDYMPSSISEYTISNNEKKQAIEIVQKKPIMSIKEVASNLFTKIKTWKDNILNIINKFKSNKTVGTIGTIIKAIAKGLIYLKTGKF